MAAEPGSSGGVCKCPATTIGSGAADRDRRPRDARGAARAMQLRSPPGGSERSSDADLVEVVEQVARIVVDAVGARVDQLLAPVTAGEQTDTEGARSSRGEKIPHA